MAKNLAGKKLARLVTNGFEQVELIKARQALGDAGAETKVISPEPGKVKAGNGKEWRRMCRSTWF
jgi:protease I